MYTLDECEFGNIYREMGGREMTIRNNRCCLSNCRMCPTATTYYTCAYNRKTCSWWITPAAASRKSPPNPARFVSDVGQNPDKEMEVSRYTYDVASDDGSCVRA
jgi:hypothetical protein